MYYPCSENKGADLRLCFRPCKLLVFSRTGSNTIAAHARIQKIFSQGGPNSQKGSEGKIQHGKN